MKINYYGMDLVFDDNGNIIQVQSGIDPYESFFATNLCRKGDRALVAGSGLGSISALLMGKLGKDSVVSYEPDPVSRTMSEKNITVNFEKFKVFPHALSDQAGAIHFELDGPFSYVSRHGVETPNCYAMETNYVLSSHNINALILDVEREEYRIIPNISIEKLRVIVVEIHDEPKPLYFHLLQHFSFLAVWSYRNGPHVVAGCKDMTCEQMEVLLEGKEGTSIVG